MSKYSIQHLLCDAVGFSAYRTSTVVLLAGTATSINFAAIKLCKSMPAETKLLLQQNYVCRDKIFLL